VRIVAAHAAARLTVLRVIGQLCAVALGAGSIGAAAANVVRRVATRALIVLGDLAGAEQPHVSVTARAGNGC
jgi:hypothetical protein